MTNAKHPLTYLLVLIVFFVANGWTSLDAISSSTQRAVTATTEDSTKDKVTKLTNYKKRYALVVGNGGYSGSSLKNTVHDAKDISKALAKVGFSVTQAINADRRELREAIRAFGDVLSANQDSVGLFFYAGHGLQVKGRNYLIPIGADIKRSYELQDEAVSVNTVLGAMEEASNSLNIVILDACRNNPYRSLFRSSISGLGQMAAPRGTWIAFSTGPGELSVDGDGRNSPYTKHLIAAIMSPGLSLEMVFKKVRLGVLQDTGQQQMPWDQSSITGDFYFSGGGASPTVFNPSDDLVASLEEGVLHQEIALLGLLILWLASRNLSRLQRRRADAKADAS